MSRSSRMLGRSTRYDSCEDLPLTKYFESSASGDESSRPSEGKVDDLNNGLGDNGGTSSKNDSIMVGQKCKEDNLYQNIAVIVVSSRRIIKVPELDIEEAKKSSLWVREYLEEESDVSPNPNISTSMRSSAATKPVDEDLYKIPPDLLFSKSKKKIGLCFSCLLPSCA